MRYFGILVDESFAILNEESDGEVIAGQWVFASHVDASDFDGAARYLGEHMSRGLAAVVDHDGVEFAVALVHSLACEGAGCREVFGDIVGCCFKNGPRRNVLYCFGFADLDHNGR